MIKRIATIFFLLISIAVSQEASVGILYEFVKGDDPGGMWFEFHKDWGFYTHFTSEAQNGYKKGSLSLGPTFYIKNNVFLIAFHFFEEKQDPTINLPSISYLVPGSVGNFGVPNNFYLKGDPDGNNESPRPPIEIERYKWKFGVAIGDVFYLFKYFSINFKTIFYFNNEIAWSLGFGLHVQQEEPPAN